MKIFHFTHTDLDGVSCAALAQLYADMKHIPIEIVYCDYDDINGKVNHFLDTENMVGATLLITDISVDKETADRIQMVKATHGNAFKPLLIDHHKTAAFLNDYDWAKVVLNETDSGTSIVAKTMFDESVTAIMSFADAVAEYDTYRFDKNALGLAKQLNYLCYMMSHEDFINLVITTINDLPYGTFEINDPLVAQMIEFKDQQMMEYARAKADEAKIINDGKYKVAYVYAENYISMTGHMILDKFGTDIDYAAVIEMDKKVHLRGLDHSPDLGAIAKERGGGGHPKAASYYMDDFVTKLSGKRLVDANEMIKLMYDDLYEECEYDTSTFERIINETPGIKITPLGVKYDETIQDDTGTVRQTDIGLLDKTAE